MGDKDPAKLGAIRLLGTFDIPSYTSIGDDYMKKIGARRLANFRPQIQITHIFA
jgi:hypothetical protein